MKIYKTTVEIEVREAETPEEEAYQGSKLIGIAWTMGKHGKLIGRQVSHWDIEGVCLYTSEAIWPYYHGYLKKLMGEDKDAK